MLDQKSSTGLARRLSTWDATLITAGSILGSAVFLTTGQIARLVPHAGVIVALWIGGGIITLAGALTYAELGTIYPRAGGQYQFLKEAYGPLCGFLFGWSSFLVIMSGGIAALGVAFGEYVGVFLPRLGTENVLVQSSFGPIAWSLNAGQLTALVAIVLLTLVNYVGVREGVIVQNVVTIFKIGALLTLAVAGVTMRARVAPTWGAPLPATVSFSSIGLGMIAVLWAYDGWYNLTFSASEIREPAQGLVRGLIFGTLIVIALYLLVNVAYVRALSIQAISASDRIAETAATSLFGLRGGDIVSAAILVSTFGCLSSTILCCSRIYLAMAQEGMFFESVGTIHPRFRTPGAALLAQGAWASVLALSGRYDQLYTYVVFSALIFHALTGSAVYVLRIRQPNLARPYRVWGYPWIPALFILTSIAMLTNTLLERPREALAGLALLALGLPAYMYWTRTAVAAPSLSQGIEAHD